MQGVAKDLKSIRPALVIVPCYNERDNIGNLINEILAQSDDFDILVIDDNSPDGTAEVVKALQREHPQVHLMQRSRKLGLGTAYRAGFKFALDRGYRYIITMDADFSHQPCYLPKMLELAASADLVIGSRYVPGGGTSGWPVHRRFISGFANWLARTVLGLSAHDCTAGFRCYRRETLIRVDPDTILSSGYSFLIEMLYKVETQHMRVVELPIIFVDRIAGKSKISRYEIYKALYTLGRLKFPNLPWGRIARIGGKYGEPGAVAISIFALLSMVWALVKRKDISDDFDASER